MWPLVEITKADSTLGPVTSSAMGFGTRIVAPGIKFPPVKQASHAIRKQLVTP